MVRFVINHMLNIENQHFRENIYMIIYINLWMELQGALIF
jgi:hypothetical protein